MPNLDLGLSSDDRNQQFRLGQSDHVYNLQYSYHPHRSTSKHEIVAFTSQDAPVIGHLTWGGDDGSIQEIHVDPEHRRQGLATRMYAMAQQMSTKHEAIPAPIQSQTVRTPAGEEWAKSLPDYKPIAKNKIKKLPNWLYSDSYKKGK